MRAPSAFPRTIASLITVALIAVMLPASMAANVAAAEGDAPTLPYQVTRATAESEPLVFAHSFPPYPLSIDNKPPETDYYTRNYLDPDGEGGIHREYGGLLRDRPVGQDPVDASDWKSKNMGKEVQQAYEAGLDGFFIDILGLSGLNWDRTILLIDAASESGLPFVIAPQVDPTASAGNATPEELAQKMAELAAKPAAYRLPSGEFVLSAFKAEEQSVGWWTEVITLLEEEMFSVLLSFNSPKVILKVY